MFRGTKPTLWSLTRSTDLVGLALGTAIGIENFFFIPSEVIYGGGLTVLLLHIASLFLLAAPLALAEMLWSRWLLRPHMQSYVLLGRGWSWVPFVALGAIFFIFPPYLIDVGGIGVLTLETLLRVGEMPVDLRSHLEASPLRSFLGAFSLLCFCAGAVLTSARGMARTIKILLSLAIPCWIFLSIYMLQSWGSEGLRHVLAWRPETLTMTLALRVSSFSLFSLSAGFGIFYTYVFYASQTPWKPIAKTSQDFWAKPGALLRVVGWAVLGDVLASVVSVILISPYGLGAIGPEVETRSSKVLSLDWIPQILIHQPYGRGLVLVYLVSLFAMGAAAAISIFDCLLFQAERQLRWPRSKAVLHVWGFCAALVTLPLLPLFKDTMDSIGSDIFLPLAALLLSYAVGWKMPESAQKQIFGRGLVLDGLFLIWRFCIRYLTPIFLIYLLLR